ncbi:MAG: tetratricopeptide repeat protein, partial [Desulfobacterales bacterium]|nr:tetratricopeptide repeat protein [Desulfobacterales bacterium]
MKITIPGRRPGKKLLSMMVGTALAAALCLLTSTILHANPAPGAEPPLDPEITALVNRGVALMGQFEYEAARKEFRKAADRAPENQEIQVNLAIAILNRQERGDESAALSKLARVLEKKPDHPRALYCSGLLELHAGRPEQALAYFNQVLALDPGDMEAAY